MALHVMGGSMTAVADSFMAAFWFGVTGWRLLERHGGAKFAPAVTMRDGLSDPLDREPGTCSGDHTVITDCSQSARIRQHSQR